MIDALVARSAFAGRLSPGRHGGPHDGVTVSEMAVEHAASLASSDAGDAVLAQALGWALPTRPACLMLPELRIVWTGPGRWLVLTQRDRLEELRRLAGPHGSVADQSDGRAYLRLAGPAVRAVLAKGVAVDLHPRAFAVDAVAATPIAHIPGLLWREAEDGFVLSVPRSFAGSLAGWLIESAAEHGLLVA